jgi:hypothetical protein
MPQSAKSFVFSVIRIMINQAIRYAAQPNCLENLLRVDLRTHCKLLYTPGERVKWQLALGISVEMEPLDFVKLMKSPELTSQDLKLYNFKHINDHYPMLSAKVTITNKSTMVITPL